AACYRGTREAGSRRLSDRGAHEEGQVLTTRQCPDCGLANEATRRFCKSCGAMLPVMASSTSGDDTDAAPAGDPKAPAAAAPTPPAAAPEPPPPVVPPPPPPVVPPPP